MRVLVVYGGNRGGIAPFIDEQVKELNKLGVETKYFLIKGKGIWGYLKNFPQLRNVIKEFKPDLIHAHYGFSGILANIQRKIPVITTFHGSDVNLKKNRLFSRIAAVLSYYNIYVTKELYKLMPAKPFKIIPCGVDTSLFYPIDKIKAREMLNLSKEKKYILFSSAFDNEVKNYDLAKKIINDIGIKNLDVIEFKGYSRQEANLLYNAVDLALMTSKSEGSPLFIKEALACNCPVVSTDVGDVREIVGDSNYCYVGNDLSKLKDGVEFLLKNNVRTNGRDRMVSLYENSKISHEIFNIYNQVLNNEAL